MNESEIQKLLDELKESELSAEELSKKKKQAQDDFMPAEILKGLQAIDKDFLEDEQAAIRRIGGYHDKIKEEVLKFGATVTGQFKQAVYSKGRAIWDTKGLGGYAVAHPEIVTFLKTGEPSISIREVKS